MYHSKNYSLSTGAHRLEVPESAMLLSHYMLAITLFSILHMPHDASLSRLRNGLLIRGSWKVSFQKVVHVELSIRDIPIGEEIDKHIP